MRFLINDSGEMNFSSELLKTKWIRYLVVYINNRKRECFIRYDVSHYNNKLYVKKSTYLCDHTESYEKEVK